MKLTAFERMPAQQDWLVRSHRSIDTHEQLSRMKPRFLKTLSRSLGLATLSGRVCPVLFEDGSAGVFVIAEYCQDDQTQAVLSLLEQKGFRLAEPGIFVLASPLLIAIDRCDPSERPGSLSSAQKIPAQRSSLSDLFNEIVAWSVEHAASDIHLNVNRHKHDSSVYFTIGGRYVCPERYRYIPTATLLDMLSVAWMSVQGGNGAVFDPMIEQQGRLNLHLSAHRPVARQVALRWASLATDAGPSVCLRLLVSEQHKLTPDLPALGYLDCQIQALQRARILQGGAVVMAGVVGSGKSTTIATVMRDIPSDRKVITLEDPVEYLIPNALQNTINRTLDDRDGCSFDTKLKTIKRSAMNDLLIGEIRDTAGGRAFMDLAGCGVNLYTTVHAGSVLLIPDRLSSSFIGVARDLLATPGILKLLVYQILIPQLCSACSMPAEDFLATRHCLDFQGVLREPPWLHRWFDGIEALTQTARQVLRFRSAQGCESCRRTSLLSLPGTQGRTVVAEMIEPALEPEFLEGVKHHDGLRLHRWFNARQHASLSDASMSGKSVYQCALYKMLHGQLDPREIEQRFGSFMPDERGMPGRV
jgi:general secretion pathway protein E